MAWDFPDNAPRAAAYPSPDPNVVGNALANLVPDYQRAVEGSQANQEGQMRLDQQRAFAGGIPLDPATGLPDYKTMMSTLVSKGDLNAISALASDVTGQYNQAGIAGLPALYGGSASGGGGASLPSSSGDLVKGLETRGYSPIAAAGIVGNFAQESSLNTGSVGDSGTSIGLANWHNERASALKAFAASQGRDWRDKDVQIAFTDQEIRTDPFLYQALQNAKTPKEAADLVSAEFERPNPRLANNPRREAFAQQAYTGTPYSRAYLDSGSSDYRGGTQVAEAGASDAPLRTDPQPSNPPVSAAGPSLGRTTSIVGRDPRSPQVGPLAYSPGGGADATAVAGGRGPGILSSLSGISSADAAALPAVSPVTGQPVAPPAALSPPMGLPRPPQAVASLPPAAPSPVSAGTPAGAAPASQAPSVAQIVARAIPDPQVAAQVAPNFAKAVGAVDPNVPLTPQQAQRAAQLVAAYAQRSRQQPQPGAGAPAPVQTAQSQTQQPLVPQVPLPGGMTDPGRAVAAIDQRIQQLSRFTGGQGGEGALAMILNLEAQKKQILDQAQPFKVGGTETYLDPVTRQTVAAGPFAGPGGLLDPETIDGSARYWLKNGKLPPNMGRGQQGPMETAAIMNRAYQIAGEQGISPEQVAERQQSFTAMMAGKRFLSNRVVSLEQVGNEASRLIPVLEAIIPQIDHTSFPSLNAALDYAKKQSGNEPLVRLGVSGESLKSVYARVLKAGGMPTEGATRRADEIFDGRWAPGQMRVALDQMKIELKNAKESVRDTMKEFNLTTGDFEDELKAAGVSEGASGGQGGGNKRLRWNPATGELEPVQ